MFNNKKSDEIRGIAITRFVVSWYAAGGINSRPMIEKWLKSITIDGKALTDAEVERIADMATTGKFELECSARKFV